MAIAARPPRASTAAPISSSRREMQSQRTFPAGDETSSARWPIANDGSQPIPVRPGSSSRISARWSCGSFVIGILPSYEQLEPIELRVEPHERLEDQRHLFVFDRRLLPAEH